MVAKGSRVGIDEWVHPQRYLVSQPVQGRDHGFGIGKFRRIELSIPIVILPSVIDLNYSARQLVVVNVVCVLDHFLLRDFSLVLHPGRVDR